MLSANSTPDRRRNIGEYVVSAEIRHGSKGVSIHWRVDRRRIAYDKLLLLVANEDTDTPGESVAVAMPTQLPESRVDANGLISPAAQHALLKHWFPWLGSDEDQSGAEAIDTLVEWFESVAP
jgi:hypothetical protein